MHVAPARFALRAPAFDRGAEAEWNRHGRLGLRSKNLSSDNAARLGLTTTSSALVVGLEADSVRLAGLAEDDVIVAVDGRPIENWRGLERWQDTTSRGAPVELTYLRGELEGKATLTVGPHPEGDFDERSAEGRLFSLIVPYLGLMGALDDAARLVARNDDQEDRVMGLSLLATALAETGEGERAHEIARRAVDRSARSDGKAGETAPLFAGGRVQAQVGDHRGALRTAKDGRYTRSATNHYRLASVLGRALAGDLRVSARNMCALMPRMFHYYPEKPSRLGLKAAILARQGDFAGALRTVAKIRPPDDEVRKKKK